MSRRARYSVRPGAKICLSLLLLSLLPALPLAATTTTEWPSFRGVSQTASVSGTGAFEGIARPALAVDWRMPIGPAYSGVSVAGGRALTLFSDGTNDVLVAFDSVKGTELWRRSLGPTYKGHDGSHDGPIATPALSRDGVFIFTPQGQLRAFEAATGAPRWALDLAADEGAEAPYYGYGSSPLLLGEHLLVHHAIKGKQLAEAFALKDGSRLFTSAKDRAGYQSPILSTLAGREQVLLVGAEKIFGVDSKSGAVLWEFAHEGDPSAMGAESAVPLVIPGDRVMLTPRNDTSILFAVRREGEVFKAEKLWESKAIGRNYSRPVYHDGYFYGYVGGFLACAKAEDGSQVWRSRPPGDGFLLLLENRLVVLTKQGSLHLAEASPAGYTELASLPLFPDHSWTPPSFADGRIYARSMKEIAAIRIVESAASPALPAALPAAGNGSDEPAGSSFASFLVSLPQASDKAKAVDAFLAAAPSLPLVEGDWVHFLYRGDAQDMGIVGDMIGQRVQAPMTRVGGTDLYFYSHQLRPAARISYRLVRNLDEMLVDPLNPRQELGPGAGRGSAPEMHSWVNMPGWQAPAFLAKEPEVKGRLEKHEIVSPTDPEAKRPIEVYLPPGYSPEGGPYPVLYVHGAADALELGQLPDVFDRLQGSAPPFLAVFIHPALPRDDKANNDFEAYAADMAERVVPFIDEHYPTQRDKVARASYGGGRGGLWALGAALQRPQVFGAAAAQSSFLFASDLPEFQALVPAAAEGPKLVYLDWGTYDVRAEHEGWDFGAANRQLAEYLRGKGYSFAGGELPEGPTWGALRSRADRIFPLLFPR